MYQNLLRALSSPLGYLIAGYLRPTMGDSAYLVGTTIRIDDFNVTEVNACRRQRICTRYVKGIGTSGTRQSLRGEVCTFNRGELINGCVQRVVSASKC